MSVSSRVRAWHRLIAVVNRNLDALDRKVRFHGEVVRDKIITFFEHAKINHGLLSQKTQVLVPSNRCMRRAQGAGVCTGRFMERAQAAIKSGAGHRQERQKPIFFLVRAQQRG